MEKNIYGKITFTWEKRKINPFIDPMSLAGLADVVPASIHPLLPFPHHFHPRAPVTSPHSSPLHAFAQAVLSAEMSASSPLSVPATSTCQSPPSSDVTFSLMPSWLPRLLASPSSRLLELLVLYWVCPVPRGYTGRAVSWFWPPWYSGPSTGQVALRGGSHSPAGIHPHPLPPRAPESMAPQGARLPPLQSSTHLPWQVTKRLIQAGRIKPVASYFTVITLSALLSMCVSCSVVTDSSQPHTL